MCTRRVAFGKTALESVDACEVPLVVSRYPLCPAPRGRSALEHVLWSPIVKPDPLVRSVHVMPRLEDPQRIVPAGVVKLVPIGIACPPRSRAGARAISLAPTPTSSRAWRWEGLEPHSAKLFVTRQCCSRSTLAKTRLYAAPGVGGAGGLGTGGTLRLRGRPPRRHQRGRNLRGDGKADSLGGRVSCVDEPNHLAR